MEDDELVRKINKRYLLLALLLCFLWLRWHGAIESRVWAVLFFFTTLNQRELSPPLLLPVTVLAAIVPRSSLHDRPSPKYHPSSSPHKPLVAQR
jgi:hypothetical protein